ncbi:sporulation protein YhbH [Caldinitratiruptor microaerophilus]|uniref:Sporulation protein YhbH n=1 Tax=Caldinitratiruptor microaerophilus TaxID=671077 RepID=A0AA35CPY8_9FIRM|nr:sporulation protein YhbH [Caldinitratiruptor microaerophilus]BDG62022.1 sporulation protein YhbH [Caldinitratiruptor microaerophilus]
MAVRFTVTSEDWSLHRQGQMDQERHQEKVREAIKNNLADIVSQENIITSDGRRVIRVPIRSLNEYRFRFNWQKREHVGQGSGSTRAGDVIAREDGTAEGPGRGPGAGDMPGHDYYEAEITVDDLGELIFEDLGLPHLDPRKRPDLTSRQYRWEDVRKQGLRANIDKKRTMLEALKRNSLRGVPRIHPIIPEDLRYKTWEERYRPETSAVVLAMMDTSGSMGEFEKYIARAFFFWMVRFLRSKYDNVQIRFLAHSTEAREVTEEEFFTKGESGGTRCSSVYELALRLIEEEYPPGEYNLYPFHFSDGDNLASDNPRAVELVKALLEVSNLFGYGEIDGHGAGLSYYRSSTLYSLYTREIRHPRFVATVIRSRNEVLDALRAFFGPREVAALAGREER